MNPTKPTTRTIGILFLIIFVSGILVYQVLRGPFLFGDDILANAALNSDKVTISTLVSFLAGILTILISVLLLPIFKKFSSKLGYIYVAFCLLNFIAIAIESYSAISLLDFSTEFSKSDNKTTLESLSGVFYNNHRSAHFMYLLTSCLPVFVLYYSLFVGKLVPKTISIFGMVAVLLMFISVVLSIFNIKGSSDLMIPIAIIQLFLPFWLIFKGFKTPKEINLSKV
ncbi:DUF4386 domain-containing protein [Tenacibaculum sp. S7007]|uniref:DUF4386 domain-containing protein n=1 Tax=Tenacibaculum pelagium TaxID=2759527 RepID=A0A839AM96_9FLAO|nr:DUF4386 domain-containing protein [Tenacibaculum pelagium]MBA6155627.1 DUF4386 domain-containing protein [Tenacibaculum pelagium]